MGAETREPVLIHRAAADRPADDSVTLPFNRRQKARQRVQTDSGAYIGIKLPRGSLLRGGDLLSAHDGYTVRINAADEQVSRLVTGDATQLARAAYHLGNRHVWVQVSENSVSYLHDHVLDDMVRQMGLEVAVINAPFEPEAGAYSADGHGHNHPHSHSHSHEHNSADRDASAADTDLNSNAAEPS